MARHLWYVVVSYRHSSSNAGATRSAGVKLMSETFWVVDVPDRSAFGCDGESGSVWPASERMLVVDLVDEVRLKEAIWRACKPAPHKCGRIPKRTARHAQLPPITRKINLVCMRVGQYRIFSLYERTVDLAAWLSVVTQLVSRSISTILIVCSGHRTRKYSSSGRCHARRDLLERFYAVRLLYSWYNAQLLSPMQTV